MTWIAAPDEPGAVTYEGPAHLVNGLDDCMVGSAEPDVMADDGSWRGVRTATRSWSHRRRERLVLDIDADLARPSIEESRVRAAS